ncbi:MAG: stage II sporulation protein M [Acidimicrobiia bacterium]
MNIERFAADRVARWDELEELIDAARRRPERLGPEGVRRLGTLYRLAAGDLARVRRAAPGDPVVVRLEDLVRRARSLVYSRASRSMSIREFVTTGFWQRVRERQGVLLVSILLFVVPFLLAGMWAVRDPAAASGLAPGAESVTQRDRADFGFAPDEKAAESSFLFTHNITIACAMFALGAAGGVGAVLMLLYQAVMLGATFGLTIAAGNGPHLVEFAFAHGVLELSCVIVAAAAGMRLGLALILPGHRHRAEAFAAEGRAAGEMALGVAACLVVAGIIEGSVSTSGIGLAPAATIGILVGGCFWTLVVVRGRPTVPSGAPDGSVRDVPAPSL